MDDDRKVTELVEQSKLVFLREAVEDFKRRQASYDLGQEFAKTKKNRTAVVPGVIMAMLLLFSIGAVAVTFYIEQTAQMVEVDFDEFDDISLRDVLNSWQQVEREIEATEIAIDEMVAERDARLELAERTGERRATRAEVTEMGGGERAALRARINSETREAVAAIQADYGPRIEELEERLADLRRRQEEEFDEAEVAAALERQDLIEDQRRLFRIELEEQREFYLDRLSTLRTAYEEELAAHDEHSEEVIATLTEQYESEIDRLIEEHENEIEELTLRYNPDLSDEEIAELLAAPLPDVRALRPYHSALERTGVLTRAGFDDLRNRLAELNAIIDRLQEIPYENSIPEALDQLDARINAVVGEYERVRAELADSYENLEGDFAEARRQFEEELAESEQRVEARIAEAVQEYRERLAIQGDLLQGFRYAFSELIVDDRENGYVVDARNPQSIQVVLDRIRDVDEGTRAVVFRERVGYIADISFFEQDGELVARTESVADGRSIRPFDRILIDIAAGGELEDPGLTHGGELPDEGLLGKNPIYEKQEN